MKKNKKFNNLQKQVRATKNFLNQNDFLAVPSDKSNRLVVTEKDSFNIRNLALLNDTSTYKRLPSSKQNSIEAQANKLINSVGKNLPKAEREKLLASGCAPASFYAFVKDHKEKQDGHFRKDALKKLRHRFHKNGYKHVEPQSYLSQPTRKDNENSECEKVYFKLNFLSDRYVKNIKKILHQYDFPVQTVFLPSKNLTQCFKNAKKPLQHDNCKICDKLTGNFTCNDRFMVYEFTCVICNEFYIGQTSRPFKLRFNEHKRSIAQKNTNSAVAEHLLKAHADRPPNIANFDLDILRRYRTPLETRLAEARLITSHQPKLNRKHELSSL